MLWLCRGAELINLMSNRRIAKEQQLREKELMHISRKLERIRLRTLRLEGGLSREEWTHFNGTGYIFNWFSSYLYFDNLYKLILTIAKCYNQVPN